MKDLKPATRPGNHSPVRSVSLQIRDYQVTVKVKSSVPQVPSARTVRPHYR
jgi:hypothetical protein